MFFEGLVRNILLEPETAIDRKASNSILKNNIMHVKNGEEWRRVRFFLFVPYNLAGGLRSPSFLIGMWFCFVFCVGACLVLFVSLVVRGMSSTSENGLRPPSFRIGNIRHVVLFCVLC